MDRRHFLKTGGIALAGFGLAGCGPKKVVQTAPTPGYPRSRRGRRLTWRPLGSRGNGSSGQPSGLRPHRDSGFVLKGVKFDEKTVIHDYGFGGAGMSLAWGCGAMAADMALEQGDRRAAVLGCGSPGLTAARQLQRRGFAVTIYALAVPPYTTSNMSSAGFTPTAGLVSADQRTPAWDAQFRQAAEISYRQLQLLAGAPGYGVNWIDNYNATNDLTPPAGGNPDGNRY